MRSARPATASPRGQFSRVLNLLLPGGGLILVGAVWRGVLIGALFILLLNAVIAFGLLIPDEIPGWLYLVLLAALAAAYTGAQLWLVRIQLRRGEHTGAAQRRQVLRAAAEALERSDAAAALAALRQSEPAVEHDLLLALRWAQAVQMEANLDQPAAADQEPSGGAGVRHAWLRVQRLDEHGIYRAEVHAALRRCRPSG